MTQAAKLEKLVKWLADPQIWTWTQVMSLEDAAINVLEHMAEIGLIKHKKHKWGGDIWTVNGHKYGRTED